MFKICRSLVLQMFIHCNKNGITINTTKKKPLLHMLIIINCNYRRGGDFDL